MSKEFPCSFCGDDTKQVVHGPTVAICVDCIQLCADIVAEGGLEDKEDKEFTE